MFTTKPSIRVLLTALILAYCGMVCLVGRSTGQDSFPPLRVKELDGSPDVKGVREIRLTNGTLTDLGGGKITISISGSGASAALDNLAAVSINTSLLAQAGVDLGSTSNPFRDLFLFGSGTYGTTSIKLTGVPTGNRTVTFPDSNTNIAIASQVITWTGPSAPRTYTLPDASATILTNNATVSVGQGGTGVTTFTTNGVLYGNAATSVLVTSQGAANSILAANAGAPGFSQTPTINTSLQIGVPSSQTGSLILAGSGGSNKHTFQAAAIPAAANTYIWPAADPSASQILSASAPSGGIVTLSWATVAGASGANPTASVGLSAVNGSASTFLRSDGAPALDVTIAPTWTGAHVYSLSNAAAWAIGPNGNTNPVLRIITNTASQADGISIDGKAAGSGTVLTALSSGSNAGFTLTPKGTGSLTLSANNLVLPNGTVSAPSLTWTAQPTWGFYFNSTSSSFRVTAAGADRVELATSLQLRSDGQYNFANSTTIGTADLGIARDAAAGLQVNNGTAGQWGYLKIGIRDAGTTTVVNGLTAGHQSTGTPAAGLGSAILLNINSSTTADQNAVQLVGLWTDATHATRTADFVVNNTYLAGALAETFRVTSRGYAIDQGIKRASTQFDKTSDTTLANVTGMSVNVAAGRTYTFQTELFTSSNVAGGVQAAIGGTATATAIVYDGVTLNAAVIGAQTRSTALGTSVGGVTAVTAAHITITGTITVNAAGTLTVQFAQNASNGAASSVLVGSSFIVHDNP